MADIIFNIGILEDNQSLRETIVTYLELKDGFRVIFSEGKLGNVLNTNYKQKPDYILLDEHLEDGSGSKAINTLKRQYPEANIIIITGDQTHQLLVNALERGVTGFLYKPFTLSSLDSVFETIVENGSFLQPDTVTKLLNAMNKTTVVKGDPVSELTKKEKAIFDLICEGKSYKEIAEVVGVSFFTVNHHIKNIYLKFGVNSKGQLFNIIKNM